MADRQNHSNYLASTEVRRQDLQDTKEKIERLITRKKREINDLRKKEEAIDLAMTHLVVSQR